MVTSDMEDKLRGIRLMRRMAVDTHARHLGILKNGVFIESREVALVESHMTVNLIAWSDTPIGEPPLIEGVRTDADGEVLVLCPPTIFPDANSKRQLSAFVLLRQLMPLVNVKVGIVTLDMQFSTFGAFHNHIHQLNTGLKAVEVQRGNLRRNRHPYIVGIDRWQLIYLRRILRFPSA